MAVSLVHARRGSAAAVSLVKRRGHVVAGERIYLNGTHRRSVTVVKLSDGTVRVGVRFRAPGVVPVAWNRSPFGYDETLHGLREINRRCRQVRKVTPIAG